MESAKVFFITMSTQKKNKGFGVSNQIVCCIFGIWEHLCFLKGFVPLFSVPRNTGARAFFCKFPYVI